VGIRKRGNSRRVKEEGRGMEESKEEKEGSCASTKV